MLYALQSTQLIKSDLDTVWLFMSDPKNLSVITPAHLRFEMINPAQHDHMYQGQIIEYYVRPLLGIKLHWVTEITHVQSKEFFVDEQRFGPYVFWHHQHRFKQTHEGVEMTDIVHYKLPFGFIGRAFNALLVRKELEQIFNHRFKTLNRIFNS